MRHGANVYVVMSKNAEHMVHPDIFHWATGNPVVTDLTGDIEHVQYGGEHKAHADLILLAPSTANTIGKVAAGIDDTPVTTLLTTAIGAGIPVIIAPAMHASMYRHRIVNDNITRLQGIGIEVLMPRFEEGKAKIPGTEEIVAAVVRKLTRAKDLAGKCILITAGPTRAYLDAFRYITNPSSGKMGVAIAQDALERGAEVTLIYGPAMVLPPPEVRVVNIETTEQMLDAVVSELKAKKYDAAILSAAASDWGPVDRKMEKTSSDKGVWTLKLKALPKIIAEVKKTDPNVILVGFKAEYNITEEELVEKSFRRLKEMNMDLIVANDVGKENQGFNVDTNEVYIINPKRNVLHIGLTSKREIAARLLDAVKAQLKA
jgi:phosphopantothenoylcysteine decarboxylase/phosphopantothenate--cysteine ligase